MKLGFLIPEFPGQTHIAWWRVAMKIRSLGNDVQVISTRQQKTNSRVHPLLTQEMDQTIYAWPPQPRAVINEIFRNPRGILRSLDYLLSLRQSSLLQKAALLPVLISSISLSAILRQREIQHVFVHSCGTAAHLIAMCNRAIGVRYALRLGGDPDVYGRDHFHKMRMADYVLSASPTYFDELVNAHGVDRSKLFWSWVGTDLDFYSVSQSWPNNRCGERLRVLTVARLHPAKGHIYALEAVRELVSSGRQIDYTIVGSGPHEEKIRDYLEEHGLGNQVNLLGAKGAAEIATILQSTDVFILASIGVGEAAPAVVCEAMACGVPVIATRIGATEYMVKDGVDGFLVEQRDSKAIRDRLCDILDNPERLLEMKRSARASSSKFDVRFTAELVLQLFERQTDM
jgi:colanic acid/amylovoran biosynthesis glycosyltransferase